VVFLDITATIEGRNTMLNVVSKTAEQVFIPLTVGGGIRTLDDIRELLKSGADKVSINTAAVKDPSLVWEAAEKFGSQCIVVAVDGKYVSPGKWEVYINSGRTPTGIQVLDWVKEVEKAGAGEILLTSIDADGTQKGYDIELTRLVSQKVSIPVIASGGAGEPLHFYQVLTEGKADAALAASLFHYGILTIPNLKKYLQEKGVEVRV